MTPIRLISAGFAALILVAVSACGGTKISETCDEPQAYQSVVASKRITVPDDLDPLDEFKEMPVPKSETPPREKGSRCIESAPSILSSSP